MSSPQRDSAAEPSSAKDVIGAAGATDLDQPAHRYNATLAATIEQQWQDRWESEGTFEAPNPAGPWADPTGVAGRDKLYILDMFPYPSGAGLHVGHPLGYIATDVYGRFRRMCGYNVLHALGYDAFGLPAEQYAVQTGQHPRTTTEDNIVTMRRQLRRLGLAHDGRRSVATTDPEFVRWTQWMFLRIWNSWYDESAQDGLGRARHIDELVAELTDGSRTLPDGRDWAALSADEQYDVLGGYRLAYLSEAPVNWCPGLGTVLSNEEVTNEGRSERGNLPVFKRNLRQWMMRITAYSDRLADDLDRVDWPDAVKHMQRNWIGRSHGASVRFAVPAAETAAGAAGAADHGRRSLDIEVFTTRPDTLFGATFVVLAPEHPLVDVVVPQAWPDGTKDAWTGGHVDPATAVAAYRREASSKSDLERQSDSRDKSGVFTGAFAINPVDGRALPVFVADYVLMGYGTGAIMAVPGQDERDWAFAERFDLPIIRTVAPPEGWEGKAFTGDGAAISSSNDEISLDGLGVDEAKTKIIAWLEGKGRGEGTSTYKLRDWLFSRQRYWGEPFPVLFDEQGHVHAVPDDQLPVELPEVPDYSPRTFAPDDADSDPEPPLGRVPEWVEVEMDLGDGLRRYRRETNTMPNWAGSCWYFLRYLDPASSDAFCDPVNEQYWMGPRGTRPDGLADPGGVDLYVGGVEHAVLHLLYARFWQKVLFDLGLLSSEEPFHRYFSQGMIQAYAYRDSRGQVVPAVEVVEDGDGWSWNGEPVQREHGKMGKSLKNVVTPDEMYDSYGADTFRVYEMSMGPLDVSRPWETRAVIGSMRFLQRLWRNVVDETSGAVTVVDTPADEADRRLLHRTIEGVRHDYAELRFNTAVAKLIELNNALTRLSNVPRELIEPLVLMVAPVAPHLAEEVWSRLGYAESLTYQAFPQADPALLVEDSVTCVVQVQGKVRDRLQVVPSIGEADLRALALSSDKVVAVLAGRGVRTVIVRAPGLVNIVPT